MIIVTPDGQEVIDLCQRLVGPHVSLVLPVNEIAATVGRHRSTVYREIKRNRFEDDEHPDLNGYYGVTGQRTFDARRVQRRKLILLDDLCAYDIIRLEKGWIPEQFAGCCQTTANLSLLGQ